MTRADDEKAQTEEGQGQSQQPKNGFLPPRALSYIDLLYHLRHKGPPDWFLWNGWGFYQKLRLRRVCARLRLAISREPGSTSGMTLIHVDDCAHPGVNATHEPVLTGGQILDVHSLTLRQHYQVSGIRWALWRANDVSAVQSRDGSSAVVH